MSIISIIALSVFSTLAVIIIYATFIKKNNTIDAQTVDTPTVEAQTADKSN